MRLSACGVKQSFNVNEIGQLFVALRAAGYNRGMPMAQKNSLRRRIQARAHARIRGEVHEGVQTQARMHGTTVLCVRRENKVVLAADGQVTMGEGVVKHNAKKTRRLFNDKIIAGFAGSTGDALSLFTRFENKLQEFHGNLARAAVELAKEWRTDRSLRHLEALLVVADAKSTFLLSGNGDVIEPDDGIVAIGSGGPYALSAARALIKHSKLNAKDIAQEAMRIASEICIYTNSNFTIEEL
jgi:ATP-dependent HslUV protease, peptidase subunit HslV